MTISGANLRECEHGRRWQFNDHQFERRNGHGRWLTSSLTTKGERKKQRERTVCLRERDLLRLSWKLCSREREESVMIWRRATKILPPNIELTNSIIREYKLVGFSFLFFLFFWVNNLVDSFPHVFTSKYLTDTN